MASNPASSSTPSSDTLTGTPTQASKSKRAKAPRKAAAAPAGKQTARTSKTSLTGTPSAETLFTLPPDPTKTPIPPYIWIDFPQEGERLLGPIYNVRMGIGGAEKVEMSIDGGPWLNCRPTSGYWWYDWTAIQPGKHVLVARMRTENGRWFRTPPCTCEFRP